MSKGKGVSAAVLTIAIAAFTASGAYASHLGEDYPASWDSAPDYVRDSVINGVEFILENEAADAAASHENWMKFKLEDGWKVGDEKDGRAKTHPALVEFSKLPPEQQFKDVLFVTVVRGAAASLAAGAETADEKGNDDDADRIAALEEEVRTLTEDLKAAQKAEASANRAARAVHRRGAKPKKPRKVGAPAIEDEGKAAEFAADQTKAVIAAMDSGEELELVFSDGTSEIGEFDPVLVNPDAFARQGASRFALREAVIVRGAGLEKRVRGVGLLVGGKQIAYTAFPDPVKVPVGQEVKFDRMIVFG